MTFAAGFVEIPLFKVFVFSCSIKMIVIYIHRKTFADVAAAENFCDQRKRCAVVYDKWVVVCAAALAHFLADVVYSYFVSISY